MGKRFLIFKKLFNEELIDIIISILLSAVMEISKKVLCLIFSLKEQIDVNVLWSIFNMDTYDTVLNIILLTLIIWGVTGLSKMLEVDNRGKKKKLHTSLMFIVFILSLIWYVIEDFFVISKGTMIINGSLCVMLLLILSSYFVNTISGNLAMSKFQSDNRIA